MLTPELNLVYLLRERRKAQNTKGRSKGCFGGKNRFLGDYGTLRVIPRSKRTPENSDKNGIALQHGENHETDGS